MKVYIGQEWVDEYYIDVTVTPSVGKPYTNKILVPWRYEDKYKKVYYYAENNEINNNTFKENKVNTSGAAIIDNGIKTKIKNNKYYDISKDSSTIHIIQGTNDSITNNIFDDGRIITSLTLSKINNTKYNNNITTGKLLTENNTLLKGATITVQLNKDKYAVKTNSYGQFSLTITAKTIGKNNVTVTYAGNNKYSQSTNKTTFIVKESTWIKMASTSNVEYELTVKIVGRLLNGTTAVKYVPVNLTVNGKVYKVKTDGAGYIRLNYTVKN